MDIVDRMNQRYPKIEHSSDNCLREWQSASNLLPGIFSKINELLPSFSYLYAFNCFVFEFYCVVDDEIYNTNKVFEKKIAISRNSKE